MTDRHLETAQDPQGLRRIAIDPITRVEGHGKVTLLLDADHRVHQARLHITEFRGFEKFIVGRPYWEVPVMVQRLCGICPVSHNLAASKAMDQIVGVDELSSTALGIRKLMHAGQILQSHALHFFHLSTPDLLFGFESDAQRRNIIEVALRHPDTAKKGILLRKFGQEVIRMTTGKRVHGTGNVPGGVQKALTQDEVNALKKDISEIILWCTQSVELARQLFEGLPSSYQHFAQHTCSSMSLVHNGPHQKGIFDFYDGQLRVKNASGQIDFDGIDASQYNQLIGEEVKPWSYMKFPYLRELGPQLGWYRVGPLARIQNCDAMPSELANAKRIEFMQSANGQMRHLPLSFHWARMIEMLHAAELIGEWLHDPNLCNASELVRQGTKRHEGFGILEAPRGTLIHHYRVDDDDLVSHCNLIVSTTHNNQAMNESIRSVAQQYLDGQNITEGLLNHIEVAIRAFDPCLSCATHALGKMPLNVELLDAQEQLIDHQQRGH